MDRPEQQPQLADPEKKQPRLDAAAQIAPILRNWSIPKADLVEISQATQRSLETVTHLTEYEDDKANRILTAMAFLSAFAAVIFAVVPSRYPFSMMLISFRAGFLWEAYLLLGTYAAFVVYALTLTLGVVFILYAVRPRFNVPKDWKPDGSKPGSHLFFAKIIEVSPTDWANAFVNTDTDELLSTYVKNSVLETYLIAEKIVSKMRWLKRGVALLFVSTIVLVVLLPLVVTTLALLPEPGQRQQSSQHRTLPPGGDRVSDEAPVTQQESRSGAPVPDNRTPPGRTQ